MKILRTSSTILGLSLLAACATRGSSHKARDPSSASLGKICDFFFGLRSKSVLGSPFQKGTPLSSIQVGVDPRSLIANRELRKLDRSRLANAEIFGRDQSIKVNSLGFVVDGHHRLRNAIENGRSVDIIVSSVDKTLDPRFISTEGFLYEGHQILNAYEVSHLKQDFSKLNFYLFNFLKNRPAEYGIAYFESLHPIAQAGMLKLFEKSLGTSRTQFSHIFHDQFKVEYSSTLLEIFHNYARSKEEFEKLLQDFRNLSSEQKARYEKENLSALRAGQARSEWDSSYYSKIYLKSQGVSEIKIREISIPYKLKGNRATLKVPTVLVRHPAWNPLVRLREVATHATQGPRYYTAHLGLDGYFYLSDGNHRYSIFDAKKPSIDVLISIERGNDGRYFFPTSRLKNLADDLGIPQPSGGDLERLARGEIDAQKLFPGVPLMPLTETPR